MAATWSPNTGRIVTTSPSPVRPEVPGAAAFAKFMRALQAVADAPGEHTVATLARATGFPRPTMHRIVAALTAENLVAEAAQTGRISLGPRLISLAFRSWDQSDLRHVARAPIEQLRDAVDETVHLAIPSGLELVYIDKIESRRTVRMTSRIGTRVALHSTAVGKAWLAALPPAQFAALLPQLLPLLPRTEHTIIDPDALAAEIAGARMRGHTLDLQENEIDICCYGAAILGTAQQPIGCISVSLPRYRFEQQPGGPILDALTRCVQAIAQAIGA